MPAIRDCRVTQFVARAALPCARPETLLCDYERGEMRRLTWAAEFDIDNYDLGVALIKVRKYGVRDAATWLHCRGLVRRRAGLPRVKDRVLQRNRSDHARLVCVASEHWDQLVQRLADLVEADLRRPHD